MGCEFEDQCVVGLLLPETLNKFNDVQFGVQGRSHTGAQVFPEGKDCRGNPNLAHVQPIVAIFVTQSFSELRRLSVSCFKGI